MPQKTLVFGYVRVSTENQLENYSIEEQISRLKSYCAAKDMALLKIYTDGGYSGGNTDRPALKQMLADIKTVRVDAVLVYKLDRLSRSQKDTLTLIEDEFLAHDVDFISINENFDTSTPFGKAMIGMLSVFAQLEKDQITERFTMGRIGRCKAGYFHGGGNAPYGYTYENGDLVINYTEAENVKKVYSMFLSGKSINAIYREMENINGKGWSARKVSNILSNVIYIGKVKFAKNEYDGNHEPIIAADTFEAAQKLLNSPDRENAKTSAQKTPFRANYLLSSLVYCARCGARYSANHGYYKCYSRSKSSKQFITDPNCKNDNWKIEELDKLVLSEIYNLIKKPQLINKLASKAKQNNTSYDRKKLEKRLRELERQMENLLDLYQLGNIPMELLSTRIHNIDVEKGIIQKQLETSTGNSSTSVEAFKASLASFSELFDISPIETQRLLVSSLIQAVNVDGQQVSVVWRI